MTRPSTGEPIYLDDNGVDRPGSQDPKAIVTPDTIKDADAAWSEFGKNSQLENNYSAQNPNISEPFSPLETLIEDAFERFGNMSVDTLDAAIKRIMLKYANKIIEDVRCHPYGSTPNLDYYINLQDTRPVSDEIMISGLAYHSLS